MRNYAKEKPCLMSDNVCRDLHYLGEHVSGVYRDYECLGCGRIFYAHEGGAAGEIYSLWDKRAIKHLQ